MRFFDLSEQKPQDGQWCLLKEWTENRKRILLFPWAQQWYDDTKFMCHSRVVQWAPIPAHYMDDPKGWKSPYRGDDLPDHDAEFMVCTEKRTRMPFCAYYKADVMKFLGAADGSVVAFMEI